MKSTVTNIYCIQYTGTKFWHIADILEMHLFIVNLTYSKKPTLHYAISEFSQLQLIIHSFIRFRL